MKKLLFIIFIFTSIALFATQMTNSAYDVETAISSGGIKTNSTYRVRSCIAQPNAFKGTNTLATGNIGLIRPRGWFVNRNLSVSVTTPDNGSFLTGLEQIDLRPY